MDVKKLFLLAFSVLAVSTTVFAIDTTCDTLDDECVTKKDSKVIVYLRKLLREGKVTKAKRYIDTLDMFRADCDTGELYHFKGVTYYLLTERTYSKYYGNIAVASFKNARLYTKQRKIRALSALWLGMFHERFYRTTREKLVEGVKWLNVVLKYYGNTRFANDALFYKGLLYLKLGKHDTGIKYLMMVKNNYYVDGKVYWKRAHNYVSAKKAVYYVLGDTSTYECYRYDDYKKYRYDDYKYRYEDPEYEALDDDEFELHDDYRYYDLEENPSSTGTSSSSSYYDFF